MECLILGKSHKNFGLIWDNLQDEKIKCMLGHIIAGGLNYVKFILLMENFDKVEELYFKKEIKEMENKKILEIELFRYDTLVFGKQLYQDDTIFKKNDFEYIKNGFSIYSALFPGLNRNTLYIKGSTSTKDNYVFYDITTTEEEAIKLTEKIKVTVEALNKEYSTKKTDKTDILSKIEKIM